MFQRIYEWDIARCTAMLEKWQKSDRRTFITIDIRAMTFGRNDQGETKMKEATIEIAITFNLKMDARALIRAAMRAYLYHRQLVDAVEFVQASGMFVG